MVDKIQFLIPAIYDDNDLTEFTATLEYIDPANNIHSELLKADEDLYKDRYIRYVLPVDSKFTYMAGKNIAKITLVKNDLETNSKYVLKSDEIEIEVMKLNDYFAYSGDSSISVLDSKLLELDTQLQKLAAVGDGYDLALNGNRLQLTADGKVFGEGVDVQTGPIDLDDTDNGIIDLSEIPNTENSINL